MTVYTKDPDAVLDYMVDWTQWLGSDSISTAQWIVPEGLTSSRETNTGTSATVWLAGGTDGQRYYVTCRITTIAGRTDDRTISVVTNDR